MTSLLSAENLSREQGQKNDLSNPYFNGKTYDVLNDSKSFQASILQNKHMTEKEGEKIDNDCSRVKCMHSRVAFRYIRLLGED